jgi:hypothetical protein
MNGKKINYYNVVKDGEPILKCATNHEASEMTGLDAGQVSTYANQVRPYHGKDGVFIFSICHTEITAPKPQVIKADKTCLPNLTEDNLKDWEMIRKAADLIRSGKGHIIAKRIKGKLVRYTEAIDNVQP